MAESLVQNRSALRQFLASISSIKGDLSNITAPPFVLAPRSAVEYPGSWAENPSILIAPAKEPDPRKRALLVLKWFLASLRRQQYIGGDESIGVKKPLNAILGELFIGRFGSDDEDTTENANGSQEEQRQKPDINGDSHTSTNTSPSRTTNHRPSISTESPPSLDTHLGPTTLHSEQVSHHPPVTACHLWNKTHNVRASGYVAQSISLTRTFSVQIDQIGHAILYLDDLQEAYLVTLPTLTVKGVLSGTPYPELNGKSYITSSTGFTSCVEYEGAGVFGNGTKNAFKAQLYATRDPSRVFYEVEGAWNDTFTFYDLTTDDGDRQLLEVYHTQDAKPAELIISDIEHQDSWESRNIWKHVIDAIRSGDFNKVNVEKSKVEEAQREMRKKEKSIGVQWESALFTKIEKDPVFDALAEGIGYQEDSNRTAGVWKFDLEKLKQMKTPYHGSMTPLG